MNAEEQARFRQIFETQTPRNGLVSGDQMYTLLAKSELDHAQLSRVWQLSDIDQDGSVDFDEFCVAMKLTFDLKYGKMASLPAHLPEQLVPASKRHLFVASGALSGALGGLPAPAPAPAPARPEDEDEELRLRGDFNWYISPQDRATYERMYSANSDPRGKVSFESFGELYPTLEIPETDISSGWNLVNPRSDEKIDREQAIVFLHILNQRSNGVRVPRSVPASLRATFSKERPGFDLEGSQAQIQAPLKPTKTFGASYMDRLGLGTHQYQKAGTSTDFSATRDEEWEEVRLKRELADLEALVESVQAQKEEKPSVRSSVVRRELQMLLEYKQAQLRGEHDAGPDLAGIQEEVQMIDEQVRALREHLSKRQSELAVLRA